MNVPMEGGHPGVPDGGVRTGGGVALAHEEPYALRDVQDDTVRQGVGTSLTAAAGTVPTRPSPPDS